MHICVFRIYSIESDILIADTHCIELDYLHFYKKARLLCTVALRVCGRRRLQVRTDKFMNIPSTSLTMMQTGLVQGARWFPGRVKDEWCLKLIPLVEMVLCSMRERHTVNCFVYILKLTSCQLFLTGLRVVVVLLRYFYCI